MLQRPLPRWLSLPANPLYIILYTNPPFCDLIQVRLGMVTVPGRRLIAVGVGGTVESRPFRPWRERHFEGAFQRRRRVSGRRGVAPRTVPAVCAEQWAITKKGFSCVIESTDRTPVLMPRVPVI